MLSLDVRLAEWVAAAVGPGFQVVAEQGLREGGSPWLLTLRHGTAERREVVLRLGRDEDRSLFDTEVAALRRLGPHGLPVPELLAADLAGDVVPGVPAVLTTRLPGTSRTTAGHSPQRLRAMGEAAALVHAVPVPDPPVAALPRRDHPIATVDFAALRRAAPARPLLTEAGAALLENPPPDTLPVFVHGDLWHGNTLWAGDRLTGLVDWDCAGVGHPGVDLGSLRCDAVLFTGRPDAADEVLAGYEAVAGPAPDVARCDVVAALATPPDLGWFVGAAHDQGRTDLDRATLLARRDAFLRAALDRLG